MLDLQALLDTACGESDPLRLVLRSGAVRRFHACEVLERQTNAEHVWRVLVILLHLWPTVPRELLLAVLYHEAAEALIGDVPAPLKRLPELRTVIQDLERRFASHLGLPAVDNLGPEDRARYKCADYLELCLTCAALPDGVNRRTILRNAAQYVREEVDRLPDPDRRRVLDLLEEIIDEHQ